VANPLTLVLQVQSGQLIPMITALAQSGQSIDDALATLGTVHYARTVILDVSKPNLQPAPDLSGDGPFVVMIVTEYDGDFDTYIQAFVQQIGSVFDIVLKYVVGGPEVIPVEQNVTGFQNFIAQNDVSQEQLDKGGTNASLYEAYPGVTVQMILAQFPPNGGA
jgi:hypothetical protein